jgi:hypothetical protein
MTSTAESKLFTCQPAAAAANAGTLMAARTVSIDAADQYCCLVQLLCRTLRFSTS